MIEGKKISYWIGQRVLLRETSVDFPPGFHVIMAANGAGKSTLLKMLAGELRPTTGDVLLDGSSLQSFARNELARRRAVLSQHYHLAFPISVDELVLMGRYPHFASTPSVRDKTICREALAQMDALHLAHRDYTTLSGGEAQKVQMSRVLAQIWTDERVGGKFLFLDEPVSHLDVRYQHQLLQVARSHSERGTTVVAVLHDINLALRFADRLLLMKEGAIVYDIRNASELSEEMVQEVFGIRPSLVVVPGKSVPVVLF